MTKSTESILERALSMPPKERAVVAERLIASLDSVIDADVEIAWQREIQKRISQVEKGEVACIPWEQVRKTLRGKSRANR